MVLGATNGHILDNKEIAKLQHKNMQGTIENTHCTTSEHTLDVRTSHAQIFQCKISMPLISNWDLEMMTFMARFVYLVEQISYLSKNL